MWNRDGREVVAHRIERMLASLEHRGPDAQGVWFDEIRRKLAAPEQADRFATLRFKRDATGASIRIEDCGAGFDWAPYLRIDNTQASDPRGRGIAVARMLSFDAVAYSGSGNIVTATINNSSG